MPTALLNKIYEIMCNYDLGTELSTKTSSLPRSEKQFVIYSIRVYQQINYVNNKLDSPKTVMRTKSDLPSDLTGNRV